MLGALLHYITRPEAIGQNFQPINSNWGILPELPEGALPGKRKFKQKKDWKAHRNTILSERALESLQTHLNASNKTAVLNS